MKIGILGDVHGNSLALAAVLRAAADENVAKLLVTGDLVGYYFAPAEALRMLGTWDTVITRGNHEDMLAAARADPAVLAKIGRKYGSGLAVALEQMSGSEVDMLCSLPHPVRVELGGLRIMLCHGAPWDNNQYIYPDAGEQLLARCTVPEYDIVVMGHTHHPMMRRIGHLTLLNPGAVGQPRNRQPGAQWALLDSDTRDLSLRCERYDYAAVAADARARHPELPYLADVLLRT